MMPCNANDPLFCFTIDVDWTPGSQVGLVRLYDFCERYNLAPTLFVTGRFAEVYPDVIREAHLRGYEIGTHGWEHGLNPTEDFRSANYSQQKQWMELSTMAVEKAAGIVPSIFRAPNLSIGETTLRILEEMNYKIDSSVPSRRFDMGYGQVSHPRYFFAPLTPYHPAHHNLAVQGASPIIEVPPSSFILPLNMSSLRVLGISVLQWVIRRLIQRTRILVLYVHPAEFECIENQQMPEGQVARYRKGLGPQNLDILAQLTEYILGLGHNSVSLSTVASIV